MSIINELLSPASKQSYNKAKMVNVYYKDLIENSENTEFEQSDIESLANNIQEIGLLHPLVVRQLDSGKYLILSGHRRYNAHKYLVEDLQLEQYEDILCRVLTFEDELEDLQALISSNSYRNLELKDKINISNKAAELYERLSDSNRKPSVSKQEWIAQTTGFSVRSVYDYLNFNDKGTKQDYSKQKQEKEFNALDEFEKMRKSVIKSIRSFEKNEITSITFDSFESLLTQLYQDITFSSMEFGDEVDNEEDY